MQQNYEDLMSSINVGPSMAVSVRERPPRDSYATMQERFQRHLVALNQKFDNRRKNRRRGAANNTAFSQRAAPKQQRRRLLGFNSFGDDPTELVLYTEKWFAWIDAWEVRYGDLFNSAVCRELFDEYEDKVAEFGYSLKNPASVKQPRAFAPAIVLPRS